MAGEIIRLGDSTSHGGKVIEGSQTDICHGKPIAYIGHKVTCPKCKGVFPIVEGVQTTTIFGKGVALAGMKTACGASLIPSQFMDVVTPGGGGGAKPSAPPPRKQAAAAKPGLAATNAIDAGGSMPSADSSAASAADAVAAGTEPPEEAAKSLKRVWWSYGEEEAPVESFSRHYVDLNIHVETENYANGEMVDVTLKNDDGTDLIAGQPELAVPVKVGRDGIGKVMKVCSGKSVALGQLG
jgi:uncharacterized Zn-binding protein involved in type VI secretion